MVALSSIFKKPEIVFATLALLFGLVFIIIIRPLNTPDEAHHFTRAYEISEGKVFLTQTSKGSCVSDGKWVNDQENKYADVPRSVTDFVGIDRNTYKISDQMKKPLNAHEKVRACGDQTSANSPIGYVPQALSIAMLRPFNAPPILMDYAARLAVLVTWTAFIYAAVRIIPVRKWAIVGIALLPIAVQQSMAIGTDVISVAPAVLFLAYVARSYYENRQKHLKTDLVTMSALISIATLAKPIMILLVLLIPFYRITPKKKMQNSLRNKLRIAAILAPIVVWFIWNLFATKHHISTAEVFAPAKQHIDSFKSAPLNEALIFIESAVRYMFYDLSLWGYGSFEWFTKTMPRVLSTVGIIILTLMLLVGYKEQRAPAKEVTSTQITTYNVAAAVVAVGLLLASIFTLYMIFTKPGEWMVMGMQFRYLLAVFFVLACIIEMRFLRASETWYRNLVLISSIGMFIVSVATITEVLPSF